MEWLEANGYIKSDETEKRYEKTRRQYSRTKKGTEALEDYEVGDKVAIIPKGSVKNIPHPRYKGRIGVIKEKRGKIHSKAHRRDPERLKRNRSQG